MMYWIWSWQYDANSPDMKDECVRSRIPQEERGGQKVECDDGYGSIREIVMSACRFAAGSSPNNNSGLDSRGNNLGVVLRVSLLVFELSQLRATECEACRRRKVSII